MINPTSLCFIFYLQLIVWGSGWNMQKIKLSSAQSQSWSQDFRSRQSSVAPCFLLPPKAALKTTFEDVATSSDVQVGTECCGKVWTQESHMGKITLKSRTANMWSLPSSVPSLEKPNWPGSWLGSGDGWTVFTHLSLSPTQRVDTSPNLCSSSNRSVGNTGWTPPKCAKAQPVYECIAQVRPRPAHFLSQYQTDVHDTTAGANSKVAQALGWSTNASNPANMYAHP